MPHSPFDLDQDAAYRTWREQKLVDAPQVDDPRTLSAAERVAWLEKLLNAQLPDGLPFIYRGTLQAGWGLISNNVLHDPSAFEDGPEPAAKRLLYRARYYDRIAGM